MPEQSEGWTDQRMDTVIGSLLRAGVLISALVVLVGGVVFLARHGGEPQAYGRFQGDTAGVGSLAGTFRGIAALKGRAIIELGLLLLIATPIARVAFSVFAFWEQRDRLYVGITVLVLAVLAWSLFGGRV